MMAAMVTPQEAAAVSAAKGPNSVALDSLLSDRSFVVDALMTGTRSEEDWGGKGFSDNPHMYADGIVDHFMYEDLLDQYEGNLELKALIGLYTAKSNWENYPLETLMSAGKSHKEFLYYISGLKFGASLAERELKKAYEDLGGRYPIEETIAKIEEEKKTSDKWDGYSLTRLRSLTEGTAEYDAYKEELNNSSDALDNALYSILLDEESACYSDGVQNRLAEILEKFHETEKQVDGETIKGAKIYDVILNDIFTSDYTSSAGITLSREMTAKEEFDQWSLIFGNYKKAYDYISDAVDLSQADDARVMIDDYLDLLVKTSEQKLDNLNAAVNTLEDHSSWYLSDISPVTGEVLALYQGPVEDRLDNVKDECNQMFFTQKETSDYLSTVGNAFTLSKKTLANYMLVDTLLRENETIRGVLNRTAVQSSAEEDTSYKNAVSKYRKLMDYNDPDSTVQILLSVLNTASAEANKNLEKSVSKITKQAVRKGVLSFGKDSVSRAKIAMTAASVANVYQVVDILDDYVAGMQDVAEKIYEIKYLAKLQKYAENAYRQDVQSYREEGDPARAEAYAGDAIDDLQFLKQIKIRQNKDAYDALSGIQDETLSGIIAKMIAGEDGSTLGEIYEKQMDALVQMPVFPISSEPFTVRSGETLTIRKSNYTGTKSTYLGVLTKDGETLGTIAEMDLYAAGGILVDGTLVVDCDIRLPQILSVNGGTIEVTKGSDPEIGYVDGDLSTDSDLHVRGSVNGFISGPDGAKIVIDGDMDCDGFSSISDNEYVIGGNLTDEGSMSLYSSTVTVKGDTVITDSLTCDQAKLTACGNCTVALRSKGQTKGVMSYIGCKNSTIEVLGDFEYYGLGGYKDYLLHGYRLNENARLILHGTSTFDTCDKMAFAIDHRNDSGKGSAIELAGNGTAKLNAVIYKDAKEVTYGNSTYKEDTTSLDFETDQETGIADLQFSTDAILGFENLAGDVELPAGMKVMGDSSVFWGNLRSPGKVSFARSLSDSNSTSNMDVRMDAEIGGDLTVNGSATISGTMTVGGQAVINKNLTAVSTASRRGVLKGRMVINANGRMHTEKRSEDDHYTFGEDGSISWGGRSGQSHDPYTEEDKEFKDSEDFAYTIDGDLLVKEDGILKIDSLQVTGDVTTEEDALTGARRLRVGGYFDCEGNINWKDNLGVLDLTLEGGADLRGLSTAGLTKIRSLTVLGNRPEAQEIMLNENVRISKLNAKDARCAFPKGIYFEHLNIDGTLTIAGDVPTFRGNTQYTGTVVFEGNVKDFRMTQTNSMDTRKYSNQFEHIVAKKNFCIGADLMILDPEGEDDTSGDLKVEGDLIFGSGTDIYIRKKEADFGKARLCFEQNPQVKILSDEVKARGIYNQYEEASLKLERYPTADGSYDYDYYSNPEYPHLTLSGGNYIDAGNGITGVHRLTMTGADRQTISSEGASFSILEVNVPVLGLPNGDVGWERLRSDQRSFALEGDMTDVSMGELDQTAGNQLEKLKFSGVYNLEKAAFPRPDYWVDAYTRNITSMEETYDGYRYTGELDLSGKTSDAYEIGFVNFDENRDYAMRMYYRKGSMIMPYVDHGKTITVMYDGSRYDSNVKKVDITTLRAEEDRLFYYSDSALGEIPGAPETILLDEVKEVTQENAEDVATFAFTPDRDGTYYFESHGTLYTEGLVAVEDGILERGSFYGADDNFRVEFEAKKGETYYLQSRIMQQPFGTYTVTVIERPIGFARIPEEPERIEMDEEVTIEGEAAKGVMTWLYEPEESETYRITAQSSDGGAVSLCVVKGNELETINYYDSEVVFNADPGSSYYIQAQLPGNSSDFDGSYTVKISVYEPPQETIEEFREDAVCWLQDMYLGENEEELSQYDKFQQNEVRQIVKEGVDAINKADTKEKVEALRDAAAEAMEKVFTKEELSELEYEYNDSLIEDLEPFLNPAWLKVHSAGAREKIKKIVADARKKGKALVDNARGSYKKHKYDRMYEYQDAMYDLYYETYNAVHEAADYAGDEEEEISTPPAPARSKTADGTVHKVSGSTVRILSEKSGTAAFTKAKNAKTVTVPATVKIKGKTFKITEIRAKAFSGKKIRTVTIGKNVKVIRKNAFKGSKANKIVIKTKLLKKAKIKGALKGSKVKTVQIKVGNKKTNKKFVKTYKKIFTKKIAGAKVKVK